MSTKPKSWSPVQSMPKLQQRIQSTFVVHVPLVLVLTPSYACALCDLWVHNKCSGITGHLTDNRILVCHECSGEIVPPAIAWFEESNIENDSFHVESTFKYFDDTISQCGGCSDAVSTRSVSSMESIPRIVTYSHQPCNQNKT